MLGKWTDLHRIHDTEGESVSVGSKVAYNLSGELAVGRVRRMRHKTDATPIGYVDRWLIEIERPNGDISKVRNPYAVLRLREPDD